MKLAISGRVNSLHFKDLPDLSGFRRQFRIVPEAGRCTAAVIDDFHDMVVTITHDGQTITALASQTRRAPFTLCPQAQAQARQTFVGLPLDAAHVSAEKPSNCTHLYDLAALAAAHARDGAPLVYDLLVCDAVDGEVLAELRRDGAPLWQWRLRGGVMVEPATGLSLRELRHWIATLGGLEAETARILQWGSIMATARGLDEITENSTRRLALRCFAFTDELREAPHEHTDNRRDFSAMGVMPQADATPLP